MTLSTPITAIRLDVLTLSALVAWLCVGCGTFFPAKSAGETASAEQTAKTSSEGEERSEPKTSPNSAPVGPRKPTKRQRDDSGVKYAIPQMLEEKRRHKPGMATTPQDGDERVKAIIPEANAATRVSHKPPLMGENVLIPPTFKTNPFLSNESFIVTWNVLGPFKYDPNKLKDGDPRGALSEPFMRDESRLSGLRPAPPGTAWRLIHVSPGNTGRPGCVDFNKLYGDLGQGVAYAVAVLVAPERMRDLSLCVGSDDYIKIWVNGTLTHAFYKAPRIADWDQDIVENVSLKAGYNFVVVKCVNVNGPWQFYFRLTNADGMPVCVRE